MPEQISLLMCCPLLDLSWCPLRRLRDSKQLFSGLIALRVLGLRKEAAPKGKDVARTDPWSGEDVSHFRDCKPAPGRGGLRLMACPEEWCEEVDAANNYLFNFINSPV